MDVRQIRWFFKKMEPIRYGLYLVFTLLYVDYQIHSNVGLNELILNTGSVIGFEGIIIEGSIRFFYRLFQSHSEDRTKLTEDYSALMYQYSRVQLIEYAGAIFPGEEIAFRTHFSAPFQFEFNHNLKEKIYELPEQIKDRSSELMKAHDCSTIYNQVTVRLEDCQQFGNAVKITYSRTTYYDLLITNRAMDYGLEKERWHTVKSVRQIYEPGPFLTPLSQSKLSNHLGFNGFVELADGYIIFVLRNANVSVGKRRWNPSVSASYKTQYGLDDERQMSEKHMGNAIRREIADELKIPVGKNECLENCIFAFYRDLVEGGKPHFVFYYRLLDPKWTKAYFQANFAHECLKRQAVHNRRRIRKMVKKRACFEFFSLEELKKGELQAGGFLAPSGKLYKMQSDGTISLALLLKHLANDSTN